MVLREVVIFSNRGGQVSARLLCPRLVVLIALAVGGGTYSTNVEGGSTSGRSGCCWPFVFSGPVRKR